jgi:hypothetical protein
MGQFLFVGTEFGGLMIFLICFSDFILVDEIDASLNYLE